MKRFSIYFRRSDIRRVIEWIRNRFRQQIWIGARSRISWSAQLRGLLWMGDDVEIGRGAILSAHGGWIRLGNRVSINPYCVLYGHGGLEIGDNVRVAAGVIMVSANHRFDDITRPIHVQGLTRKGIVIESDVWIGAGCLILDGVRIGTGAVIGGGSVVIHDIPTRAVVVGNPAKIIRIRGQQSELLATANS